VVTRHEEEREDGGIQAYYELIAGERRLRASKLAGLAQVPVVIRSKEESDRTKLELAIIENLQREDLNAIDRARAFQRLAQEFKLNNAEIGRRVGKSREYVSNSLRLLTLPDEIQNALKGGAIYEGHARALLMLQERPEEMMTVFKEVTIKKLSVRDVEKMTREIAWDKARKRNIRPEIEMLERKLAETLGTKVEIREQEGSVGSGKVIIDFFSEEDLAFLLQKMSEKRMNIAPRDTKESNALLPVEARELLRDGSGDDLSLEHFSI
jgi:ParB family transcriptional regulator, chromosome partitioning protein